ncbi:MAG: response regulator [bacterium]|nr:response regulator [bacterium]
MSRESERLELERLAALDRYRILDSAVDPVFDDITALVARNFQVPLACIALVDADRIWIKSAFGMERGDVVREAGLCLTTLQHEGVYHLRDASEPASCAANSIVAGGVRFYAGCSIRTPDGYALGTVCAMGPTPRDLTTAEAETLEILAQLTLGQIERHCAVQELAGAQESLREGEEHYRILADLSPVGIFRADTAGDANYVNTRWAAITGMTLAATCELGWVEGVHPGDRARVNAAWRACVDDGFALQEEFRFLHPTGMVTYVLGQVIPVKAGNEGVSGFVGTITDITSQRELEQRVQEAQKLESLGLLASGIAHDFNNILATIMGYANLALSHAALAPECRGYLASIDEASQRAAGLCDQLLAYAGRGRFTSVALDLNEQVRGMGTMLEVSISKKAYVTYRLTPNLPTIEGDVTQIRQVLLNLITNASEALGGHSGTIEIVTSAEEIVWSRERGGAAASLDSGSYVVLEVRDTGCGLEEDIAQRVFEPFYTTKHGGRGLGLAAVQGIVRAHRGAIEIETKPGLGTTFRVMLPASSRPIEHAEDERPLESGWRGEGTVLVVDDDDLLRDLATRILTQAGFGVLLAKDGVQAIEVAGREHDRISLVLLDMTMPGLDGAETLIALRQIRADVPVLVTSGYNKQDAPRSARGEGATGFIKKPYRPRELIAAVRELLERG